MSDACSEREGYSAETQALNSCVKTSYLDANLGVRHYVEFGSEKDAALVVKKKPARHGRPS